MIETVIKRNGTVEPFDSTKFNKLTRWSAEVSVNGENEVDWSQLALDAMKKLYNNCTTKEIILALISSCLERTEEAYFYIAGKLQMSLLYKDVYSYNNAYPPHLYEHLERMIEKNLYLDFLKEYSEEEINELDSILDHSLDFKMTHSQINQCMNKYLISNKLTDEIFETPQFMNMRVALDVCHNEPNRVEAIKEYYNRLKNGELNLPTTMWANLGTPQKTGTSCLLLSTKDTIGSLTSGDHIANIMTVAGAGIGTVLFTRSKKDPIQKGRLEHLGKIPYYKLLQANIDATMQSGARRGAATTYINVLDPEIETLIHLRNPTSIPEEKVDGIDYAFSYNKTFVEKFKANEDWMLISYYYSPDLWEAMYEKDTVNFDILYEKYLNDETIPKKLVNTRQLVLDCLIEQLATGRLYEFNCTNANRHTPFKEPIVSSNLCIASNQLVPSNKGLLTAEELYNLKENLILTDGQKEVISSPMKLREFSQDVYKITLKNGMSHTVTDYHKIMTKRGLVKCKDLIINEDYAKINVNEGVFGTRHMPDEAYLLGLWQGDGTRTINKTNDQIHIDIWEDKTECLKDEIIEVYKRVRTKYTNNIYEVKNQDGEIVGTRKYGEIKFLETSQVGTKKKWRLTSTILSKYLNFEKNVIPRWLRESDKETQLAYIKGLFQTDGTYNYSNNAHYLSITQTSKEYLEQLQILLNNLGYLFSLSLHTKAVNRLLPDSNRNLKNYACKDSYRLVSGSFYTCLKFEEDTGFISFRGKTLAEPIKEIYKPKEFSKIISIEYVGKEDVYCPTVESDEHLFVSHCFITKNCNEIYLPTKPHSNVTELYKTHYDEGDGYVQTCNLASINLKRDYTDEEYLKLCYWALKTIDYVIDNSEYKLPQIGVTTKKFRSAGVSFINLAYYLASHKLLYTSESGKQRIHEISERHEYMLMKASLLISKERGNAEWIHKTRYPEGWLPIDTYSKAVDDIAPFTYKYDWEELRKEVIENKGLAHCCLSTIVPSESSSLVCNATNAIYPIRKPITTKTGSNSKNVFMAPEYEKYKDYYQIAWDVPDLDNIHVTAIVQKFISQGISFDDYNDHTKVETNSGKRLVKNWLARDKYGLKGKYYTNNKTQDNDDLFSKDVGCGSGGCTL